MEWLDIAKSLPAGRKRRIQCCKQDASMLVSHSDIGYTAFCFRCGFKDFQPHGQRRICDINRHNHEFRNQPIVPVSLPKDYQLDIPKEGRRWFLQYGIDSELAAKYRFGWTPKYERVVIPIYSLTGELDALQMRAVLQGQKPKYINPTGPNVRSAVFMSGEPNGVTVVTEDVLSAIKVGRVHHATSILGTTMTDERAAKIAKYNHTAIVWLDPDGAGIIGTTKACRQLQLQGVKCYIVRSELDPKKYNSDEIKEHLRSMKPC